MGAEQRVKRAQTRDRRPPSALVDILCQEMVILGIIVIKFNKLVASTVQGSVTVLSSHGIHVHIRNTLKTVAIINFI